MIIIKIWGPIGRDTSNLVDLQLAQLKDDKEPIIVLINSEGGTLIDAIVICNLLKAVPNKKITINIPDGINTGDRQRLSGKGNPGSNGGDNGDLYIEILVNRHEYFIRDGKDISIYVPLSALDATLGCTIDVPTVYGDVELRIPAGTQHAQKFRLRGKGVKNARTGQDGDQYVIVELQIPKSLSKEETELYEKLRKIEKKQKKSLTTTRRLRTL